ncbi:kinesin-related [Holotrichia oblita]|uniref:Kinesin-related n=1 Tax=Holotrichia oblita TaxID=644536 RepID=A0ACB9SUR8_HOLOL|nr:kinesin-related [Holotrichia oblita]
MIAHVSPASNQKDESRNTLTYADRAKNISSKAERNVLDVSYHVSQYQTVINELRDEINRLQQKMTEDRPRSAEINKITAEQRSNEVKKLREQIVETFKMQMKLRRKLMEIDSHLLGLGMEAERQHLIISHWESRNNKLYKGSGLKSRAQTQQTMRYRRIKRKIAANVFKRVLTSTDPYWLGGNCINALSGGARYVNYRDSKLTRLLKEALSGNCRTVMIAHVSPASNQKDESRNTLTYADRAKNISSKAERNVLDVSYHVSQYQTVINELRDEINRLQQKMTEDRPRSAEINKITAEQRSLGMEAERQHLIISHWESRNNKLYKGSGLKSRAQTQQTMRYLICRKKQSVTADSFKSADHDFQDSDADADAEGEMAVQQAWGELADIEREQERWSELRTHMEQKLEACRQRGVSLEDKLPGLLSSDDEREILALMCRVHELEADKMALQSERLVRQHELRRRDLIILRYDRQRQLCEEIITRQRLLIEENKIKLPTDLQELYQLYQQEIHASTYTDYNSSATNSAEKLPPISKIYSDPMFRHNTSNSEMSGSEGSGQSPPSSAESDQELLPPLSNDSSIDRVMGQAVTRPGLNMKLPPLPPSPPVRISKTSSSSRLVNKSLINRFDQSIIIAAILHLLEGR